MNLRLPLIGILLVVVGVLGVAGGYWVGLRHSAQVGLVAQKTHPEPPGGTERKILYWHDPMYPQQKFDKPGKSPFMDMQLEPVYADKSDSGSVEVSSRMIQNLGVRTSTAEPGRLQKRVNAVGSIQADEHRIEVVQSRTEGWVEKLHVRAVNDAVVPGQLIAEIYSPELLAAQEEFLLLTGDGDEALRGAARARLASLGLSEHQIAALERERRAGQRVRIYSPTGGVVAELGVRQGGKVSPGTNLVSLIDLSTIWVIAEVAENLSASLIPGTQMDIRIAAFPGETFRGKVEFIYPDISLETRTVRVRASLRNPGLRLRPGMVANVTLTNAGGKDSVWVPSESVIYTGKRNVVIVAEEAGRFRPVEIKTGADSESMTEVLSGLEVGERVVVSGQFLIDSEASLKSTFARFEPTGEAANEKTQETPGVHRGTGVIRKVNIGDAKLTIEHGPIASLDWPPMTMDFAVNDKALLEKAKPGQQVEFEFAESGGGYLVSRVIVKP